MADITNIGSNRINVQWPNPDKNSLTIRPPNSITKPLFGILTPPDTIKQDKNFSLDVDTSTPNGTTTIYEINGNTRVKIGTLTVDDKKNSKITLDENIKKTFPPDAIKDLTDPNSQFFKTISNSRKTWIRDNYQKKPENSGKEFNGVDQVNLDQSIPQESTPESQITGINDLKGTKELPKNLERLEYPIGYAQYNQDFIEFKILKYVPRVYNFSTLGRLERFKTFEKDGKTIKDIKVVESTVILPIQGGISDMNSVSWNAEPLDAVKQAAAFASLSTQQQGEEANKTQIGALANIGVKESANVQKYLQALFSRLAISSETPFFSRAYGAILNPNLELLFQTADLRAFNFRFDLTPRSEPEAAIVKRIIRVFKQTMSVKQGVADIFLKAPMIYEIRYINGRNIKDRTELKSINRIKTCALRSFSVNYTPNNQYMTYYDDAATMSSYSLDMQFAELEPVYYNDYKGLADDEIGY
jgi:hypothetical protein